MYTCGTAYNKTACKPLSNHSVNIFCIYVPRFGFSVLCLWTVTVFDTDVLACRPLQLTVTQTHSNVFTLQQTFTSQKRIGDRSRLGKGWQLTTYVWSEKWESYVSVAVEDDAPPVMSCFHWVNSPLLVPDRARLWGARAWAAAIIYHPSTIFAVKSE